MDGEVRMDESGAQGSSRLIAAGLFIASLALYLGTLAPSVVTLFDDSLEFQLVTYQLGIAHPTGYPLYTLLGKLFTFLPVGNVAYRVNLMSAVFGAATVALVYRLIWQLVDPRPGSRTAIRVPSWPAHLGGITGAALLAVGQVFWRQATIAEVYTLNAFFVVLLLWLALRLPADNPQTSGRRVVGLAFVFGLSLTHHRTVVLLLPALLIYLWLVCRPVIFNRRVAGLSLLGGLLPLLLYAYLPLRGHIGSLDGTYQNTWAGFWRQVSAGGYGLFIFGNPFGHQRNLAFYLQLLSNQFYTTIPGLIGLVYLFRLGRKPWLLLTGLAFVTYTVFNLFYHVTDIDVFFIPVFVLWAAWSGVGAAFLLHTAATLRFKAWRPAAAAVFVAIFGFIVARQMVVNRAAVTGGYSWQVHDYGLDMLAQPPDSPSAVVGILGEMTLLRYFQQTEHLRPDIETVAADAEADRLAAVERLLAEGKTVFLTRELPGAAGRWSLNAVGPLIRVDPEPVTSPPDVAFMVGQPVTPDITLVGYNLSRPPHTGQGPPPLRLTLFWQARAPLPVSLKVSARLLDMAGNPVAAADAIPVHFAYPTTAWRGGELVSDVYDLILPVDAPAGRYTPLIIWYNPAQNAAEAGRIELAPVTVVP